MQPSSLDIENRVLVLAPSGGDSAALCHVLQDAGVLAIPCGSAEDLCRQVGDGAAAAIVADEALNAEAVRCLVTMLAGQPEWSDFPLILMTAPREDSGRVWLLLDELNGSAYPLLLERPVSKATLIRATRTVLQSRRRQYQIRDHIAERQQLEDQLRQKCEELSKSDRRKDEFLAVLGHELRNPLAAIVNGIQVLASIGKLEPEGATICDVLQRQAEQMTHLVDDLLDLSRVSRGSIRLQIERTDLVPLVRDVTEEHRAAAEESGCTLEVQMPERLVVNGDPTRLRQILGNLIHNACKFTDPGGRITISGRQDAQRQTGSVTVRDTGIGMSEESLARLFQPFNQAESSLDRSRSGLGLGLALVAHLVELHGGTVSARSEGIGKGSEFLVELPLAEATDVAVDRAEAASRPSSRRAYRILLVEDSQPVAAIFSLFLKQMGHEVEVAYNAATALEHLGDYRPQIVFSDISMPGMSGYELAQTIRREPAWNDLVLVAVTGYGQPEDCERARQAGFDHHLVKPADAAQIEALFDTIAGSVGEAIR